MDTLAQLRGRHARDGTLVWIGLRPAKQAELIEPDQAALDEHDGLVGDHWAGRRSRKRQLTLIQAEHLPAIAALADHESVAPALLRRNLMVEGVNLLALREQRFHIGSVVLEGTGHCHPCSRMEKALGPGGYNAVRGHGGITARVVSGGTIRLGDTISAHGVVS